MATNRRQFLKALRVLPLFAFFRDRGEAAASNYPEQARRLVLNRFSIAGFQYYDGRTMGNRIKPGEALSLLAEPTNPYDPFAVEIYLNGFKLGYVPRSDNKHISRLLEQGARLDCSVIEVDSEAGVGNAVRVEVGFVLG